MCINILVSKSAVVVTLCINTLKCVHCVYIQSRLRWFALFPFDWVFSIGLVAIAAGRKLAHRLFDKQPDSQLDYTNIPSVVFSHPPVGSIGLTESNPVQNVLRICTNVCMCSEEAVEKHGSENIKVYKADFLPMYYQMVTHRSRMKMKLITVRPTEKVQLPHTPCCCCC